MQIIPHTVILTVPNNNSVVAFAAAFQDLDPSICLGHMIAEHLPARAIDHATCNLHHLFREQVSSSVLSEPHQWELRIFSFIKKPSRCNRFPHEHLWGPIQEDVSHQQHVLCQSLHRMTLLTYKVCVQMLQLRSSFLKFLKLGIHVCPCILIYFIRAPSVHMLTVLTPPAVNSVHRGVQQRAREGSLRGTPQLAQLGK